MLIIQLLSRKELLYNMSKKILFVAGEAFPFAKSGGLGDVIGSLPKNLISKSLDVRVIIPLYRDIPEKYKKKMKLVAKCDVDLAWRRTDFRVFSLEDKESALTFYFLDQPHYFDRPGFYGYFDDAERFAYFSRAVLAVLPLLDFKPDVIHAHDWHTALVPLYLHKDFIHNDFWKEIKTVFTIHNLAYQGVFSESILKDVLGLNQGYMVPDKLEFFQAVNLMKGAICYADAVTTVSESYAREIQTPQFGEKLDPLLCAVDNKLTGILNGIDYDVYNPATDPDIAANYRHILKDIREKRPLNRVALQKKLGLHEDENAPVIAIVSRLVRSKGMELLCEVLPSLLNRRAQIVVLGTGDRWYEEYLRTLAAKHVGRMSVSTVFDEKLAKQIYAGSDIFLMPSMFEPCGLSQMMAMRYGSLPFVHEVGGLRDSVIPYNFITMKGTGFSFSGLRADTFMYVYAEIVMKVFGNKPAWEKLVQQAMRANYSWSKSADKYVNLYNRLGRK